MKPVAIKAEDNIWNWAQLMQWGLGKRNMHPDVFWQLSLPELYALLPEGHAHGMGRAQLEALMDIFPDHAET